MGLVLMAPMLSKSLIQFSLDGWGCVPFLLSTWGQTMMEVMKIMATSFKRTCALTDTLSGPNPAPRLHQTPGHSQASLGQSLVGSLLLSPGFWCIQGSVCALPETVFPVSSGGSMVGLMVTSSKRAYAIPRSPAPRAPAPAGARC